MMAVAAAGWAGADASDLIRDGQALAEEGKLDDALAKLQQAVELDPNSALAHTRLGGIQVLKQDYALSIQSFQQAIMLDQANADAFVGMAVAYLHLGQYELAREALREAQRLDPSKQTEIEKVLTWLEQRSPAGTH
jgi:tetratricopeptide (TPR) repeat protein